ncbi:putative short transient receptor potential channel 2-like protein isoform X2 [Mesocricetus auratus]|uniref:Short transient receptor potential channel 2-like protein isoform X2 n=1 Tax=Mesocricetus auratus TaxID=10036 RepID=A0ABM2YFB2_MESAU|nr:putative short transient receptor potential channel 2-like protein isoform X2 [Mesocricetus auratus]
MAPVKISHVVSFSSQDPKYPVENLLNPDSHRGPWLSCPRDKSGQLRVELQLERVVPISYIDVGNCGCAFLQIDVGRSSWPLDRPFVTLLPATMLMSLADSKEGKNRSGVRMFKDGDFLTPASGESWDRLRLTCSQPFTRHQSFGLAFLRVRSSLDHSAGPVMDLSAPGGSGLNQSGLSLFLNIHLPFGVWGIEVSFEHNTLDLWNKPLFLLLLGRDSSSDTLESDPKPWLTNPSIQRTFFPGPQTSTKEISELKGMLKQLQPGPLGRAARMVLSAAHKAPPASVVSPKNSYGEPSPSHPKSADHCPTQVLSQIGAGQQEQSKDSTDLRPKMTMVSRPLDNVPFVQAPSARRHFLCMLPLVERAPHRLQLLPLLHLPRSLCCGCPPQRAHQRLPGCSALFVSYSSQQEK